MLQIEQTSSFSSYFLKGNKLDTTKKKFFNKSSHIENKRVNTNSHDERNRTKSRLLGRSSIMKHIQDYKQEQFLHNSSFLNNINNIIRERNFINENVKKIRGITTKCHTESLNTSSDKYDYDLIIIGCGVGGHGAAIHAVEKGLKTAVIEGHDIGGTCVNRGCVPSKALLAASGRVRDFKNKQHLNALGIQVSDKINNYKI